jgi:hypothetical protein
MKVRGLLKFFKLNKNYFFLYFFFFFFLHYIFLLTFSNIYFKENLDYLVIIINQ